MTTAEQHIAEFSRHHGDEVMCPTGGGPVPPGQPGEELLSSGSVQPAPQNHLPQPEWSPRSGLHNQVCTQVRTPERRSSCAGGEQHHDCVCACACVAGSVSAASSGQPPRNGTSNHRRLQPASNCSAAPGETRPEVQRALPPAGHMVENMLPAGLVREL